MTRPRSLRTAALVFALAAPLASLACGPKEPEIVKANVVVGSMPDGGSWRGVWYSQTYGYLHLLQEGNNVHGKWRTASGDKWGEMHGSAEGDVYRFQWEETKIGMFGPAAKASGKGYFKYVAPADSDADHELHGEWGLGENEAGYTWNAIKQRRMEPDPDSVMPDETQTAVEGADWDGNKSKNAAGAPEDKKKKKSDSNDPVGSEDDSWD